MSIISPLTETPSTGNHAVPAVVGHPEVLRNLPMTCVAERGPQLLEKLLEQTRIDWNGYAERKPTARSWAGEPVPVIRRDSALCQEAVARLNKLSTDLAPITESRMATFLYKMQGHYWQPNMTETLAKNVAMDYLRLLGGYGDGVFSEVYDEVILERGRKFCPTIGEMKERLEVKTYLKKTTHHKLKKLIERAE